MSKAVRIKWAKGIIAAFCDAPTGQDASSSFEDVGHSPEARALSDQYRIGTVVGGHPKLPKDIAVSTPPEKTR